MTSLTVGGVGGVAGAAVAGVAAVGVGLNEILANQKSFLDSIVQNLGQFSRPGGGGTVNAGTVATILPTVSTTTTTLSGNGTSNAFLKSIRNQQRTASPNAIPNSFVSGSTRTDRYSIAPVSLTAKNPNLVVPRAPASYSGQPHKQATPVVVPQFGKKHRKK